MAQRALLVEGQRKEALGRAEDVVLDAPRDVVADEGEEARRGAGGSDAGDDAGGRLRGRVREERPHVDGGDVEGAAFFL